MSIYLLRLTSFFTIFYFTINTTVERTNYPIKKEETYPSTYKKENSYFRVEITRKQSIRNKTLVDLNYHLVKKYSTEENIVHIILNQDGKILGYKPCAIFYPNYFTKTQPRSIIKTSKQLSKNKTNLCLIKLKMHKAKIDF